MKQNTERAMLKTLTLFVVIHFRFKCGQMKDVNLSSERANISNVPILMTKFDMAVPSALRLCGKLSYPCPFKIAMIPRQGKTTRPEARYNIVKLTANIFVGFLKHFSGSLFTTYRRHPLPTEAATARIRSMTPTALAVPSFSRLFSAGILPFLGAPMREF